MSKEDWTLLDHLFCAPVCDGWSNRTEGAFYQLGHSMLFLGYMGGSGAYGCLFLFGFLTPSYVCLTLWGCLSVCGLDVTAWNLLLLLACLGQICHLLCRLHQEGLRGEELSALYRAVYLPLGVPVQVFKEIAGAFENRVLELKAGEKYAVEGKTPIEQLSFLLSGRVNVSLEGQFLHYIHPHQFLDSPEWESLRPNEDGKFQVTLTAEEDSRYISWRRRRLFSLLSKERYVARLFSVMLGLDIAEKLYNLNNKLYVKSGVLLDIRLPSLYHVLAPSSQSSEGGSANDGGPRKEHQWDAPELQLSDLDRPHPSQPRQQKTPSDGTPQRDHDQNRWVSDPELPSGGDGLTTPVARFQRNVRAPLAPTDTPKL